MTPILIYDSETTGLPDWHNPSGGETQPHIVQLGALLVDEDTRTIISSMDIIVRPDGWDIPQDVVDIHGITKEHAMDVGVPEQQAVELLLSLWNGRTRVAHNETFDARIIRIATKRYFNEQVQDAWKDGEKRCTGRMSKEPMDKKGRFAIPKLTEAFEFFCGRPLHQTHRAMDDAQACMELYFAIWDYEARRASAVIGGA